MEKESIDRMARTAGYLEVSLDSLTKQPDDDLALMLLDDIIEEAEGLVNTLKLIRSIEEDGWSV